jgi:hypothetical protein
MTSLIAFKYEVGSDDDYIANDYIQMHCPMVMLPDDAEKLVIDPTADEYELFEDNYKMFDIYTSPTHEEILYFVLVTKNPTN